MDNFMQCYCRKELLKTLTLYDIQPEHIVILWQEKYTRLPNLYSFGGQTPHLAHFDK